MQSFVQLHKKTKSNADNVCKCAYFEDVGKRCEIAVLGETCLTTDCPLSVWRTLFEVGSE